MLKLFFTVAESLVKGFQCLCFVGISKY